MNKDILRLSGCQALFTSSTSIMIATSAIIGASLSEKSQYATVGAGMTYLAMMLCSYPMSILMGKIGRRGGFIAGFCVALIGSLLISHAISLKNFGLYCASAFIMGCGMSCGLYLRFAAVEVADRMYKGKAISYVLAGGIVAAILGPNLARLSRLWLEAEFSGAYLCAAMLYLLIIIILIFVKFPVKTKKIQKQASTALSQIFIRPVFLVAAISALTAYGSMNLIMTATPLSMHEHGHGFSKAAIVIQWHILGMFVPSLFTGALIQKLGLIPMMMIGCLIIVCATLVNLVGTTNGHYIMALILLGVGWNFLFVGATQLLTRSYNEQEKSRTQGLNDFLVAFTIAVTAISSGWILSQYGWAFMNKAVLTAVCSTLIILIIFSFCSLKSESFTKCKKDRQTL